MHEKKSTPTQNVQRVKAELRDKDPSVNVVTRSGMATRGTEEEVAMEPLIWQIVSKQEGLDLEKGKETCVTDRKDFSDVEVATARPPTNLKIDEEVEPFLQACMKLLHNPKVVDNLQALIYSCTAWPDLPPEVNDVHKLYRYKKRTGREMRLSAQIGDYEMSQVILDLGSDANVLPKQTWKWMGEPKLEWSYPAVHGKSTENHPTRKVV